MPVKTRATTRPPTRRRTPARRTPKPAPLECVLVVRRGATKRYEALRRRAKTVPVTVMWDPRKGDRRTGPARRRRNDRRQQERRQGSPFPWDLADFFVLFRPAATSRR